MSSTTIPRKTEYMPPTLSTLGVQNNAPQCEFDGFKPSRVRRNGIHVSYDVSAERRNTCLLRWPLGRGGQRAATRA